MVFNRTLSRTEIQELYQYGAINPDLRLMPDSPCVDAGDNSAVTGYDCVGYWHMDDDAGTKAVVDISGNGNNGTAQQNTSDLTTTGKINSALTFNGSSDYVDCGNGGSLVITGSVSILAWIKLDSLSNYQTIVAKRGAVADITSNYALRTSSNQGELDFYYHDGTEPLDENWHVYTTLKANLTAGQWYHTVLTFTFGTGTSIKCYVNNNLLISGGWTSGDGNSSVQTNTKPVTIGGLTTGHRADGLIDNVMIFDRALSTSEIEALYNDRSVYYDITGNHRILDGPDAGETATVDMGAYEFTRNILVSPDSFDVTLSQGNTDQNTLTISNTGDTSVNFNIEITGDGL